MQGGVGDVGGALGPQLQWTSFGGAQLAKGWEPLLQANCTQNRAFIVYENWKWRFYLFLDV